MKYYSYNEPVGIDCKESINITVSEEEIIKDYYEYWSSKMIEKFGEEHFNANYCVQDCVDDWVVVNWAWEVEE